MIVTDDEPRISSLWFVIYILQKMIDSICHLPISLVACPCTEQRCSDECI
jgi:hypothetical protein